MPLTDPVPSSSFDVLERNIQDTDKFVNQETGTFTNRVGKQVKPIPVIEAEANAAVISLGWHQVGLFADGFTYLLQNDIAKDAAGYWYRWNGALPKVVTAGTLPSSDVNFAKIDYKSHAELSDRNPANGSAHNADDVAKEGGGTVQGFIDDLEKGDSQVLVGGVKAGEITSRLSTAEQRILELPSEIDAAGTAALLISEHNHASLAHPELSAFISSEADRAETAADAAELSAGVYADKASGISATIDGQYFSVISVESENYVDLYKNVAESAVFQKSYPSVLAITDLKIRQSRTMFSSTERDNALDYTNIGERFMERSDRGMAVYDVVSNLYNPSAAKQNYFLDTIGVSSFFTGWAHSDYIPLTGSAISISSNTVKRAGYVFYDEAKNPLAGTNNDAANPLTLTVPENAKYLRFNVKSPTIPEPTEIMVNNGSPIPFMVFGDKTKVEEVELLDASLLSEITQQVTSLNLFNPTDIIKDKYLGSELPFAINSAAGWGYALISVEAGQIFTIYSPSGQIRRDGVGFFTQSSPATDDTAIPNSYTRSSGQSVTVVAPPTAVTMVVNVKSPTVVTPDDLMIVLGSVQVPYEPFGIITKIPQSLIHPPVNFGGEPKSLTLIMSPLAGSNSKITSVNGVEREFIPYPSELTLNYPVRFNLRADKIGGFQLRDLTDDIAPDHIDNATVGANHGYSLGEMTSLSHGKLDTDCGSVWLNSGNEYVLADIINSNVLLLATRLSNTAPPVGTFTHVSGAVNTSDIVVSSVTSKQWYPPHKNRTTSFMLDGVNQLYKVATAQANEIVFIEQADILARTDIIEYWIANGGMPASYEPQGDASVAQTIAYQYDKHGQLTISRDWTVIKDIAVQDLMGLQFGRSGAELEYIVPGSLPFSYNGNTVDYGMGVPSDNTLASGSSVFFTASRLQAVGEYANRVLVIYENHVFAIGLLPVGDASESVRRDRVSNVAMEIRGNTGKLYFRVLDKGAFTSLAGESYGAVGYRNIMKKSADRIAFYAVKNGSSTYVFADWRNKQGLDRLPFFEQFPELVGKEFEVVESRNTSIPTGSIAGATPIYIDAVTSSATLILKVNN